jgi:hypothetical protein
MLLKMLPKAGFNASLEVVEKVADNVADRVTAVAETVAENTLQVAIRWLISRYR